MRLLVECPECSRQYDVSRRKIGSRLRCHCGEIVTVRQPEGFEAAVVRCSSCGAARPEQASQCPYCQSDFTLHERDLNTVCPHCLARVSDRARFCHHCGIALVPEQDAGAETDLTCPACQSGPGLVSRQIGAAMRAEALAGPHGAGMIHSMFMKSKSTVIECFSPEWLNPSTREICRALRHRYFQIVAPNTPFEPYRYGRNVEVDCNHLELVLQNLQGRD